MKRSLKFLALLAALSAMPSCSWFSKHPVIPAVVTCSGETIPIALVTRVYDDTKAENWIDLAENVVPLLKDGYADLSCIWNYLETSNPETLPHINAMKAKHADAFKGSVSTLRSPGDSTPKKGPIALDGNLSMDLSHAFFSSLSSCPAGTVLATVGERFACFGDDGHGGVRLVGYIPAPPHLTQPPSADSRRSSTDTIPAIGCLNGTVLRETAPGDWNCMRPDALPAGAKTLTIFAYPGPNPGAALERCDRTCGEHLTSLATVKGCLCWRGKGRAGHWVALREAPGIGMVAAR